MELQNQLKQMAAKAALEYVVEGEYLGVGTGTTVGFFITELATSGKKVKGCVSSSEATTRQLLAYGIPVCDLNDIVDYLPVYIDGCDEIDGNFCMIKGGGGALTREKIVAQASEKFVCIADESKVVKQLGAFPLPLEVIPMAVSSVSRAMEDLGGHPVVRDFITDNGNNIKRGEFLWLVNQQYTVKIAHDKNFSAAFSSVVFTVSRSPSIEQPAAAG